MIGRTLFFRRLREEGLFQLKVLHSVFDWVIMIYIALPALIILPFFYVDMWRNIDLYWSVEIPFNVILLLVLLFLLRGNFRTFVIEADILFVTRRKRLFQSLKRWALFYSIGQVIIVIGLLVVLLLPILVGIYGFMWTDIIFLIFLLIGYQLLQQTIKKFVLHRFVKGLLASLLLIGTLFAWQLISEIVLFLISTFIILAVLYLQARFSVQTNKYFLQELDIERTERVRYIQLIYNLSREIKKTPRRYLSKPYFFYPSKRIFRDSGNHQQKGLLELAMKGFMRDRTLIMSYLNLFNLSIVAIFLLPIWLKWVVLLFYLFALNTWLRSVYDNLLDHPFFTVVRCDKDTLQTTWHQFKKWLAYPTMLLVGVITVLLSLL